MDLLGLVHTVFAAAALVLGPAVFFRRKGDRLHRRLGYGYVAAMVLLNGTAFAIYDLFGGWGIFHWFALVSMLTILGGFIPAYLRRPAKNWFDYHYYFMCWSYVGLMAAALAEVFTRVPQFWPATRSMVPPGYFWMALGAAIFVCVGIGWYLISFRRTGYLKPGAGTAPA